VINLKDVFQALIGLTPPLDVPLSGVVIDSRQALADSLFVALPGERVNGHDFVQAAFDNGAVAALVDQEMSDAFNILDLRSTDANFDRDSFSLPICLRVTDALSGLQALAKFWREKHPVKTIGITGSVGKTTTKELTSAILSLKYSVLKNPGNRNNEIGLPLTLLELEPHHQFAVLEMGFYVPGEIKLLCQIAQPQVGVVTNVGTVHAERAGSQEIIAKGKAELIEALPAPPQGIAILNKDDPWVWAMRDKTHANIFSYSVGEKSDLFATEVQSLGLMGISCQLHYQGQSHHIQSPSLGEFSVYMILRATAVALSFGMDWDVIKQGLSTTHVDLRMHPITLPNGITIIDDTYNASPASTLAALQFLRGLTGRRVAILGDMLELGPYEQAGHTSVGTVLPESADVVILVGQRSKGIAQAAIDQGFPQEKLQWYPDSSEAAQPAVSTIQEGDIVLIKGSNSMRMDKILKALQEGV
jgi:UDP-N-acetylmuramoyl-tripeptide--D-alanyl-D-alanine ligase